jgi:hypothetical protein
MCTSRILSVSLVNCLLYKILDGFQDLTQFFLLLSVCKTLPPLSRLTTILLRVVGGTTVKQKVAGANILFQGFFKSAPYFLQPWAL